MAGSATSRPSPAAAHGQPDLDPDTAVVRVMRVARVLCVLRDVHAWSGGSRVSA